jgi:hypothetical protein
LFGGNGFQRNQKVPPPGGRLIPSVSRYFKGIIREDHS